MITEAAIKDAETKYQELYQSLNEQQRVAVDTLQGPVLVVAGPGTGKTQIIATRIMNLLRSEEDQVEPYNILCLTYTDNGAVSMRKRLLSFIGPAAHHIKICTFHSFCNDVIQSHLDYFEKRELELISDLERVDLMEKMINDLPKDHPLKKLKGDLYADVPRLTNLFNVMKSENWMPELIHQKITEYLNDLPNREEYVYKKSGKGFKAGDLKQAKIEEQNEKMDKLRAAVDLYPEYVSRMRNMNRYDYQDMILWVIKAFKESPRLLMPYKEQFRYVLVDEFQDTNGAQNEILNLLIDDPIDNYPNVFCVGDDDQSIYEFQGARIHNILEFAHRYRGKLTTVVLTDNYRSTQAVLDVSKRVIENNNDRLINQLQGLTKDIRAARPERLSSTVTPKLFEYQNTAQEEAGVCHQIEQLIQDGVKPSDIAVLYYKHAQAENLINYFNRKGLPYQVKKKINILHQPLTRQIVTILTYIDKEYQKPLSGEVLLFEMMHYHFFGIHSLDVMHIGQYVKSKSLNWRLAISEREHLQQIRLRTSDAVERLGKLINKWIGDIANQTLQMLFEKVIYESGLIAHIAKHKDRFHLMEELNTFYDFVKQQNTKNPKLTVSDLVKMLEQMEQHHLSIDINKTVYKEDGVVFSTCHGAKGSEYRYVFVIGCVKDKWEGSQGNNRMFTLPDTLTYSTTENQLEAARRLFYVALTRAEEYLFISYHRFTNEQKELERSVFVEETGLKAQLMPVDNESLFQYQITLAGASEAKITLSDTDFIKSKVENLTLSHSTMNTYLECPIKFYFQKVLCMPSATNDSMVFGNSIHKALEMLFKKMKENQGVFPPLEYALNQFKWFMNKQREAFTDIQFENRMHLGIDVLTDYYNEHVNTWHKNVELEYTIRNVQIAGVPCTGVADKIELHEQGAVVIDYKTGKVEYAAKELKAPSDDDNGGDYWRQMHFYKLLLDADKRKSIRMIRGEFHFVEKNAKDKYEVKPIEISETHLDWMRNKIKEVYDKIQNLEFDKGCNDENCYWCNFVKQNQITFEMN